MNGETEKILTWIRREARAGAGVVSLTHQNVGGFGAPLGRWPIAEEDSDAVFAQLANDLYRAACDDADGQAAPGPQQYVAHYYAEPELRAPASRLPFLVVSARQTALGPPGEGFSTEPPTQSGFVGQVMRHNEFAARHAWQVVGHALGMIERHATQVSQENARLQQHNFELVRGYEGLLTERHVRELAAQNAMHERKERTDFYNRIFAYFPALAPALLDKLGLPAPAAGAPPQLPATAARTEQPTSEAASSSPLLPSQIKALLESMTQEQLVALNQLLRHEQMAQLGAIWMALNDAPLEQDAAAQPSIDAPVAVANEQTQETP